MKNSPFNSKKPKPEDAGRSRAASSPRSSGIPASFCPRVGFIVTNMARTAEKFVVFYNKRGTCEQYIGVGKGAINGRVCPAISCARWRRRGRPRVSP